LQPIAFSWPQLIKVLDRPERNGADTSTLKLVVSILLACPPDANPHVVEAFWTKWNNPLHQIKLLEALVSLPSDTFNFVRVPGRRVVTVDDVAGASPTIKALAANVQGQTWNSLPLFEILMSLADLEIVDVKAVVREMLEKAVRISSELVHMGLLQVPVSILHILSFIQILTQSQKPWNEIQHEFASQMLAMFLAGHPNHQLVFMRIWQIDQGYLTQAFIDFYQENQLNITRISDIAQDLKVSWFL
jgi:CCR4-NOT transcription complex subunit 1